MKKFFLCFAVISLFFFIASCGESSTNSNEKPDSGDTVNDEDTADTDSSDTNPDNPDSDDPDTGATGKCEISNSYTNSSFDQYFRFKGESLVNDLNKILEDPSSAKYNEDVTTRLYLSQKYTFEKTEGSKDGDKIMAQIQNYLGDTSTSKILNKFKGEGVYLSTFKIVPIGDFYSSVNLYAMTALPNSVIKSAEKDPNGRINLKSAPDVIVFSIEYQNVETEKAWLKTCPVAVTKTSGENGSAQLCPGEDGSFAADQTVKIGVNAELTTDEKDILAFADNAKSIEELCVINCSDVNGEFDSEKKECRCKKGYTWNAGSYECVEEKDDTDTTPDEDSDTIPEPSDDDADTVPEQNDDDADTGVVEPTEAEKCAAVGGTWNAETNKCSKTVNCDPMPATVEHAEWNGASSYTQDYVDGAWLTVTDEGYLYESIATIYSENAGTCRFKCSANYNWTGSSCVDSCYGNPCNGRENAIPDTCTPTGQQTFNCGCVDGYYWTGVSCDKTNETICTGAGGTWNADTNKCTKTVACSTWNKDPYGLWNDNGKDGYYTQELSYETGLWTPASVETVHSDEPGDCHYKCDESHYWESTNRVCDLKQDIRCTGIGGTWAADQNKCIKNCDGKPENTEWNGSETYASTYSGGGVWSYVETVHSDEPGECHYKCAANYFWYSETCVNPCEERLFEEKPDGTYVYTPCNKWFADEHTDGSCTPTGATTYICGCEEAYAWNSESNTCDLTPCTIDDSFAASDYDEHFLFKGFGEVNDINNPHSMMNITSTELDLIGDDYDFEGSSNVVGYIAAFDGNLQLVTQKTLNNTDFLMISSYIPAENLNSAVILDNGKMNVDAQTTTVQTLNLLYSGEETVIKSCIIAVSQFTGNDYTAGNGRVQVCLGENRTLAAGEGLNIGIDAELNSAEDYVADALEASGTEACTFTCMNPSTEVKDPETGRCGCIDGYTWDGSSCVLTPCEIDDSFASSDYEEHFLFKGSATINDGANPNPINAVGSMEIDLFEDAYDINSYDYAWAMIYPGLLELSAQKVYSVSPAKYLLIQADVEGDILNNAEILPNGKVELGAPTTNVVAIDMLYSGEEQSMRYCIVAYSQHADGDFDNSASGRMQLCLGDNRNFEIGEQIRFGMDAQLNSDDDYIRAAMDHFNSDLNSDFCGFSCMNNHTEVKDAETGRCGCKEGYTWNGSSCVNVAEEECMAVGGTWDGTQCTIDGLSVCSETSTTPCIDPETRLIWSEKADKGMKFKNSTDPENITYPAQAHCESLNASNYGGFNSGWHLPTIDELRTLIIGCEGTVYGGACAISDPDHLSYDSDYVAADCKCGEDTSEGHSKLGETGIFWSSSVRSDSTDHAWYANFTRGWVNNTWDTNSNNVICVRNDDGSEPLPADPCDPNPCGEHSTCTVDGENYECGCVDGYTWDGEKCLNNCSASSDFPCIDPETRLIWSSKTTVTAENIVSQCENSTEGGFSDWQTATISQLRTLVSSCDAEALGLGGTCGVTDDCSESSCYDMNDCYASCSNLSKLGDDYLTSSTPNEKYWSIAFGGTFFETNAIIDHLGADIKIRCARCADGYAWNGTKCVQ